MINVYTFFFSDKNLNFLGQLLDDVGSSKCWKKIKAELSL